MAKPTDYELAETRIQTAGVMRCCLATVGDEWEGQRVKIGAASACKHCKQTVTLIDYRGRPVWYPDWQLDDERKQVKPT